eukprot:s5804_g1.t1
MQLHFFLEVMEVVCLQVLSKQQQVSLEQQGILEQERHPRVDAPLQCHQDFWMPQRRTLVDQEVPQGNLAIFGSPGQAEPENLQGSRDGWSVLQVGYASYMMQEFSLMSRLEALHYREAALKYTVKKADKQLLLDVLREVGAEIQISDLRLNEGDLFLLYSRNLPDKVVEYAQLHCGATSVALSKLTFSHHAL